MFRNDVSEKTWKISGFNRKFRLSFYDDGYLFLPDYIYWKGFIKSNSKVSFVIFF